MTALVAEFKDAYLLDGMRTAFVDYRGAFAQISPIDLGIKAARAAIAKSGVDPRRHRHDDCGLDGPGLVRAYVTPRHIGLYAGVPVDRAGASASSACAARARGLAQAADAVSLGRVELVLASVPRA